jgi:hypothetical protein
LKKCKNDILYYGNVALCFLAGETGIARGGEALAKTTSGCGPLKNELFYGPRLEYALTATEII